MVAIRQRILKTQLSITFTLAHTLADIDKQAWDTLALDNPVVSHRYLLALETSACASDRTGWQANHLLMHRNGTLCGAMPMYLKSHSRGEYVFDQGWAQAFERHGLAYYPKLLSAIPFTPVPGPRLLANKHEDKVLLAQQAANIAAQNNISSLHILFPDTASQLALAEAGFMIREHTQFHWHNQGYSTVDEFLSTLSQKHRKKINQDSKKAMNAGVSFRILSGQEIDNDSLTFFYHCYEKTYLEHGNRPYLSLSFFQQLTSKMAENVVLILAEQQGQAIAAAFNLRSDTHLYGRYWGCTHYIPGLHFETCYLQGIKYCIANSMAVFEGGAQGEHKLSRGLLPVPTRSAHWIADTRYASAISNFLDEEASAMLDYRNKLASHSPFKK